jgi:tetratricopeptide (TPR) repeat protein/predicted phosphodiesterase
VFATGDIAHSGQEKEYELATTFFDALIAAAGVEKRNLFVIPGNHDVDRDLGVGLARTLTSREEADKYFNLATPKVHITQKLRAFVRWYNHYFDGIRTFPENSTCDKIQTVDVRGLKVGILPINSALFCEDDNDHAKLWVGRRCVDNAIKELQTLDTRLNIALVHHPLDWLSEIEAANVRTALATSFDFVLRGHLHTVEVDAVTGISGQMRHLAAGAAYDTRGWPNRAIYADIDGDYITIFPIRYEDQPEEVWRLDPSLFPHKPSHEANFPIPRLRGDLSANPEKPRETAPTPQFKSNIPSRRNLPFVGRDGLLDRMLEMLSDLIKETILVLLGPPGVGKSELAREFARRQLERYPGGTFLIDAGAAQVDLARIGRGSLDLEFPPGLGLEDQCIRTLHALAQAPSLLIFDNVTSVAAVFPWLPPAGMQCHVLMTTVLDRWDAGWVTLRVDPLSEAESLQLIKELAGRDVAERYGAELTALASGLPVQIVPASVTLAYEARRGRRGPMPPTLTQEAAESFRGVYSQLDASIRLLLHLAARFNAQRIPRDELKRLLVEGSGWSEIEFQRALDAGLDLHLLQDGPELRIHRLFVSFLRSTVPSADIREALAKIGQAQAHRMVEIAKEVEAHPNRPDLAATFLAFPLDPQIWADTALVISVEDGETIGRGLVEIGGFTAARPWFERAVIAAENGGVHGRVDHESLGKSLHQVGHCLASTGDFAAARRWFERAVEAAEKGDLDGRVDYASLGRSLHQVGYCLSSTGDFATARRWFEDAIEAAEKGDLEGRVDHESLGVSLHQMGICISRAGDFRAAQSWFKRAVEAAERGDIYGRVDHASVGGSLHQIGTCLSMLREFAAAQPWFERAVEAKQQRDVHGRVDFASVGRSLHQVGFCLSSTGNFTAALEWFKRAVEAAEKGDVHGRIDHEDLGKTMHQLGFCLSSTGDFATARGWFERAVEATEQGDIYGRVDHEVVGRGLHQVGFCLWSTDGFAAAWPWFERAVAAKEKGDVHGRVDRASLALSLRTGANGLRGLGLNDQATDWDKRAADLIK